MKPLITMTLALAQALLSDDPCDFDHHGGCQSHGYLSLEPGEGCPQAQLLQIVQAATQEVQP